MSDGSATTIWVWKENGVICAPYDQLEVIREKILLVE